MSSLIEKAGGIDVIRAVLQTFYDNVFSDMMIGFFFVNADKARIVRVETELVARALGDKTVRYSGEPLQAAHKKHPILGGHFERRLQLLREAMEQHDLPDEVRQAWVEHTQSLRPLVTDDVGSECDHDLAVARMERLSAGHPADAATSGSEEQKPPRLPMLGDD